MLPFLEGEIDNQKFCRIVKRFPNDDFSVRIQDKNLELGAWFAYDICNITKVKQNVAILFSSSRRYLLCRKRVDIADRFYVLRTIIIPGNVLRKQGLPRTSLSNLGLLATADLFLYVASFRRNSRRKLLFAPIELAVRFPVQIFISFCRHSFLDKTV